MGLKLDFAVQFHYNVFVQKCTKCLKYKEVTEFSYRDKEKGTRHSHCKACVAAHHKEYYASNRNRRITRIRERGRNHIREMRKYVYDVLGRSHCIDCNEEDIRVLVFDHVRGSKIAGVLDMARRGFSFENIKKEIKKCEVRCLNCHGIITWKRRKSQSS